MAIRRELVVVAVILLIAVGVKLLEIFQSSTPEVSDASKFVLEDLRATYPGADISIMSITPKYNQQEKSYLEVKARVTQKPLSPCPERLHIYYNYPVQNFVPQPPEVITGTNCQVCMEGACTIAFPEEAVIASHTLWGTKEVQDYLHANIDATPLVTQKGDSWLVRWDSEKAGYSYLVEIHRNSTILSVRRLVAG